MLPIFKLAAVLMLIEESNSTVYSAPGYATNECTI